MIGRFKGSCNQIDRTGMVNGRRGISCSSHIQTSGTRRNGLDKWRRSIISRRSGVRHWRVSTSGMELDEPRRFNRLIAG